MTELPVAAWNGVDPDPTLMGHGDEFRFDGDRAVLIGADDDIDEDALAELVRHALTDRRR